MKPIGGANNGNARRVLQNKRPAYYAAQLNKKYISKRKPKYVDDEGLRLIKKTNKKTGEYNVYVHPLTFF